MSAIDPGQVFERQRWRWIEETKTRRRTEWTNKIGAQKAGVGADQWSVGFILGPYNGSLKEEKEEEGARKTTKSGKKLRKMIEAVAKFGPKDNSCSLSLWPVKLAAAAACSHYLCLSGSLDTTNYKQAAAAAAAGHRVLLKLQLLATGKGCRLIGRLSASSLPLLRPNIIIIII